MKDLIRRLFEWIRNNKITAILLAVVIFLLLPKRRMLLQNAVHLDSMGYDSIATVTSKESFGGSRNMGMPSSDFEVAPRPGITDRKVITRSSMSLQVKSVREAMGNIKQKVSALGGYVIETNVTTPEFGEDGSIVIRIPADSLDGALTYFRDLSVKVVSENISGTDITDEYIDIEERINRLEKTKTRFEEILEKAEKIEDILRVQREIFNLQDQIDRYKGQLNYMEGASSTTLIRIYLSTDELGLPYAPSQAWRPEVVFKQATRSLLLNLIKIGNAAIWVAVYIPFIAFFGLVYILVKKVVVKKIPPSQN